MKRRDFVKVTTLAPFAYSLISILNACSGTPKHILVVSGWQDVNIGDIAHTPGLLHVLESYLPKCKITLWKKSKSDAVEGMLKSGFPNIEIIYGEVDRQAASVSSKEVLKVFKDADILVHGSGPGLAGRYHIEAWQRYTQKPYGIFGITIASTNESLNVIFSKAAFIFVRETISLNVLKEAGIEHSNIMFAPDATFYFNMHDEKKAETCLREHEMQEGKYICVIPRLRYTPYHKMEPGAKHWMGVSAEEIDQTNEQWKDIDHEKLRKVITTWVRQTGNKVLICPEMTYQVNIMDELLIDPLPDDVKPFVSKRGYWLPDEAASIYRKSFAVVSFECHSPILAAANGRPFIHLRQPQDTIKGQMYYDLGFENWVFEIEETDGIKIANALMGMWEDVNQSNKKVAQVNQRINKIYREACLLLHRNS